MTKGENIYKRKDGRWEGRYKKGYDQNNRIKYGYCYGHTYHEVREKLALAKASYIFDSSILPEKNTDKDFTTYTLQWLKIHQNRLKKSSFAKYTSILENHIRPSIGMYRICELSSDKFVEFTNELLYKKQLSVKTVRDILTFTHEIITYVQNDTGCISSVIISYPKLNPKELRVLSVEEQHRLTDYLIQDLDIYKFSVLLSLFTGLRIGEVCALRWNCVSLDQKFLTVTHTVQRIKNPDRHSHTKTILLLDTPKTFSSIRTIPITDGLVILFEKFQTDNPSAFVMTGNESFVDPRKLQRRLKKYTTSLELREIHFHTLRHTFATRCIESGFDPKTLSEILGHSNISTTMNRYVHPSLEFKRQNMQKLEQAGFFSSSHKPS